MFTAQGCGVQEVILALIVSVALEVGVPPAYLQSIALVENPTLSTTAVNYNSNGTNDVGIMQLNSAYFNHIDREYPEQNIKAAALHVRQLLDRGLNYWSTAIAYNCGIGRIKNPPSASVMYATRVMNKYTELSGGYVNPIPSKDAKGNWK